MGYSTTRLLWSMHLYSLSIYYRCNNNATEHLLRTAADAAPQFHLSVRVTKQSDWIKLGLTREMGIYNTKWWWFILFINLALLVRGEEPEPHLNAICSGHWALGSPICSWCVSRESSSWIRTVHKTVVIQQSQQIGDDRTDGTHWMFYF